MNILRNYILIILGCTFLIGNAADEPETQQETLTTKQERNYIREGNKLYREKRFADAEVQYRKALDEVPSSETAAFNLAASLIRQSASTDMNDQNNPMQSAQQILDQLAKTAKDINIAELAYYNLGNIAFNQQNYQRSIDMYKNSLRKNPENDLTRENLRLAQIRLKEQQDQNDNQNQNQDQEDKEQNQDQNKDQNQDQNKNQDQQDQNQDQQQDKQENKDQQKQQPQRQGMSDANAEKILKAMENEEAATRRRVEAEKKKAAAAQRKKVTNPW